MLADRQQPGGLRLQVRLADRRDIDPGASFGADFRRHLLVDDRDHVGEVAPFRRFEPAHQVGPGVDGAKRPHAGAPRPLPGGLLETAEAGTGDDGVGRKPVRDGEIPWAVERHDGMAGAPPEIDRRPGGGIGDDMAAAFEFRGGGTDHQGAARVVRGEQEPGHALQSFAWRAS